MKYSKSTGCFYPDDIHYADIPDDLFSVSDDDFAAAMSRAPGETLSVADVREIDGVLHGRIVIVAPPEPTVAEQIASALASCQAGINAECARRTAAVRADTPQDEVQSWGKQEQEARALLADPSAATPLLTAIAAARGVPLPLLAEKVVDKSDAYAIYTGALIGTRQALEDRMAAIDITAPDALAQIDAVQWPEA